MLIKSKLKQNYLQDLANTFALLCIYDMTLNLENCAFGVQLEKVALALHIAAKKLKPYFQVPPCCPYGPAYVGVCTSRISPISWLSGLSSWLLITKAIRRLRRVLWNPWQRCPNRASGHTIGERWNVDSSKARSLTLVNVFHPDNIFG
ncbi:hypothetical protein CK203_115539 [Vitis vinifera]|uniref:Uncharacterized protein n=1 Tax=Vitis vinifera TaxID=29760 RepID=A0A438FDT6_VITVI|nr:hypothetical protein CK203_115539 [Vitis vinifera]